LEFRVSIGLWSNLDRDSYAFDILFGMWPDDVADVGCQLLNWSTR